jgi:alpha-methylacyl-CoA racemase
MLAALIHARAAGQGQVVDAAMTDGAASLMAMFYGLKAAGLWTDQRRANLLDGGAHMYDTYHCSDGEWVAIGSLEPKFYALLLEKAGLSDLAFANQMDRASWPELKSKLASVIASRSRDEWCALMEGTDVCFAPVLKLEETPRHPHNLARETFVTIESVVQPAPSPRFSATPGKVQGPPPRIGADDETALSDWGFSTTEIDGLKVSGALDNPPIRAA